MKLKNKKVFGFFLFRKRKIQWKKCESIEKESFHRKTKQQYINAFFICYHCIQKLLKLK